MPNLFHLPFGDLVSPLTRAVTEGGGGGFNVLSLFAAGEQGAIYDPSDLSTVFSDAAGTTPAVVDGVVGKILDKSGRGNHRTQSTTAQKPFLRSSGGLYWLEYDGVDDGMVTASVDFSATGSMTVCMGIRKTSDAAVGSLLELTASADANNGGFWVRAPATAATANYQAASRGTITAYTTAATGFAAPITNVLTMQGVIASDVCLLRGNRAQIATTAADQGTGTYANAALYFGRRNGTSIPFTGNEYYTVIRGAASTATQVSSTERIAAQKCGVTL